MVASAAALFVNDDTPLDLKQPPPNVKFCVALSAEGSACTTNPSKMRRKVDHPSVSSDIASNGVDQIIDGNESERKATEEVLKLMNVYWYQEVLSNHDYDKYSARTTW